jgi:phage shock protein PspC (stress-responsive transcriptional regulator)
MSETTEADPTQPAPPLAGPPALRRRIHGRYVAGVASGLGAYLRLEPTLLRIGFVVLMFFGGFGLLLYALAWAFIPAEDQADSLAERGLRRAATAPTWAKVLGVVLLLAVVSGNLAPPRGPGLFWGLVLVAVGILLFRRSQLPSPAPVTVPQGSGSSPLGPAGAGPPAPWPPPLRGPAWPSWTAPPPAPSRPRRRPFLGPLTILATVVALSIAVIVDSGSGEVTLERFLAISLVVVGAGLCVGAVWGRAYGLILLGIPILLALLATSVVSGAHRLVGQELALPVRFGEVDVRPGSVQEVEPEYRLSAGRQIIDLSDVSFGSGTTEVSASVGMGELIVVVDEDVTVEAAGHIGLGELAFFGEVAGGADVRLEHRDNGPEGGGRLVLDLAVGLGSGQIHRVEESELR